MIVHTYHLVMENSQQLTYLIGGLPFLAFGGFTLQFMSMSYTKFLDGVSIARVAPHERRMSTGVKMRNT